MLEKMEPFRFLRRAAGEGGMTLGVKESRDGDERATGFRSLVGHRAVEWQSPFSALGL